MNYHKLLRFFFFCISLCFYSQQTRFTYEYQSIKDSTQKGIVSNELYALDSFKNGSLFFNYQNYREDSLGGNTKEIYLNTNNKVYKNYPKFDIFLYSSIDNNIFRVKDERKLNWKILSQTTYIGPYKSQKATVDFAGRTWIAWFCVEIPIQDGPYKFHGLPGLITKIEDNTKSHIFELKSVVTIKNSKTDNYLNDKKIISISIAQYFKIFHEYRNDPMKSWRQKGVVKGEKNNEPDNEFLKNMLNHKLRQIAIDNNIIELELLK